MEHLEELAEHMEQLVEHMVVLLLRARALGGGQQMIPIMLLLPYAYVSSILGLLSINRHYFYSPCEAHSDKIPEYVRFLQYVTDTRQSYTLYFAHI